MDTKKKVINIKTILNFISVLMVLMFWTIYSNATEKKEIRTNSSSSKITNKLTEVSPFDSNAIDYATWGPTCPNDEIMHDSTQIEQIRTWESAVFARKKSIPNPNRISIEVIHQDYNRLRFNESCMGNKIKIGPTEYKTGLGTHANSEILVHFPKPVKWFSANIGIDNNSSTHGSAGSVIFAVLANKKEIFRSGILTGKDKAQKIELKIDPPTSELTLLVETTEDGPSCDQADWAEAKVIATDDTMYSLSDRTAQLLTGSNYPFSFIYGGKSSTELLPKWTFKAEPLDSCRTAYRWTDPETGLIVEAVVRHFENFAAIEWLLNFKNGGKKETPILSDVKVLETTLNLGLENIPIAVHTLRGDSCNETSWLPELYPLKDGEEKTFSPVGGRPSNGVMPFWNISRSSVDSRTMDEGVFMTIGWSGQWSAKFRKSSPHDTHLSVGQEEIATVLYPDESIRSPRILLMPWHGERIDAHVLWRRLLLFEYAPKWTAGPDVKSQTMPVPLEIFGQCFDRYYRKRTGWEKYDQQVEFARRLANAGCTSYWFDAAWFPVGFPNGVGNWFSDKNNFPNGLEALGAAVHQLGLKFTLWFEPERVAPETDIAQNHSEFVFGGKKGGLYKLSDPAAEKYMTDLLSKRIEEYGVNIYRNDFNIDPLNYWRDNDEPNRRGMTEIRYIEAHYRMWDTIRSRHPGLWIDNCASGGRRIDLETISRSISLWRSDTCCWPGHPEWDQIQSLSIAQYIPLFASVAWDPSPYTFRSAACPGAILQYNFLDDDYNPELTKQSINEAKVYQKFWYGDFYPLSDAALGKTSIIAFQLHRPDLAAGLVYIFRQTNSPYLGRNLSMKAIEPTANYKIRFKSGYKIDETKTLSGTELVEYPFLIPEKQSAIVIEYEKIK